MTDPTTHTAEAEREVESMVQIKDGLEERRAVIRLGSSATSFLAPAGGDRPAQDKVDSLDPITVWGEKM